MAPPVGLGTEGPVQRGWDLWIAGVFVAARFIERIKRHSLGIDDWMILVALVSSVLLSVTEIEAVVNGYGVHAATLSEEQRIKALKWFFAAQVVYKVVIMLDKISILCLYYRIFKIHSAFRITVQAVNAFIIMSGTAYIIATIFQCTPVRAFWDHTIQYTCIDSEAFWVSYATINMLTDVVILVLPVRQVMRLKITNVERVGLLLIFSAGAFATATTIARTTTLAVSAKDRDATWGPLPATVWSVIEANAGIIAACLPTLRSSFIALFAPCMTRITYGSASRSSARRDGGRFGTRPNAERSGSVAQEGRFNDGQYERSAEDKRGRSDISWTELDDQSPNRAGLNAFRYGSGEDERESRHRKSDDYGNAATDPTPAPDSDSEPAVNQRSKSDDGSSRKRIGVAVDSMPMKYASPVRLKPAADGSPNRLGHIYINSDVSISVSRASVERGGPANNDDYYAYAGSVLRHGMPPTHSGPGPECPSMHGERPSSNTACRDFGRDYCLRGI